MTSLTASERPFGLSRVTVLPDEGATVLLADLVYDPVGQVNLCPCGAPRMGNKQEHEEDHDHSGENPGTTHINTQHDHQWSTDTD
ncbi:putative ATP-grasp-modified RiPP [Streptomyces sp. NPDC049881]|uniref:putative ATP-grasp-modified RiPP n=1 Tax=Streptomyces sp. NPDC049881 TaxID=3155778 RepID=UPI00341A58CF